MWGSWFGGWVLIYLSWGGMGGMVCLCLDVCILKKIFCLQGVYDLFWLAYAFSLGEGGAMVCLWFRGCGVFFFVFWGRVIVCL